MNRKLLSVILVMLLALLCTSCDRTDDTSSILSSVNSEFMETKSKSNSSDSQSVDYSDLPSYISGTIITDRESGGATTGMLPVDRKYREIFYNLNSPYRDLADSTQLDKWINENLFGEDYESEMAIMKLVRDFKVPKEKFEEAIEKQRQEYIENGFDMKREEYEIPNADIIYTFNNEIINNYYRID